MPEEKDITPYSERKIGTRGKMTEYDPSYGDMAIELMGQGMSLSQFASHIRTNRKTIFKWRQNYPEFNEAMEQAETDQLAFVDKIFRERLFGGLSLNVPGFSFIYHKEHPDVYPEKTDGNVTINLKTPQLTADEMNRKINLLLQKREESVR